VQKGERNQAIGISRGGRSTRIHALVDGKGRPLHFVVTGGQVHDNQELLQAPQPALAVTADKAYDRRADRCLTSWPRRDLRALRAHSLDVALNCEGSVA
jgi:Transposase DDE domain